VEIVRIMFPASKIKGMALAVRLLLAALVALAAQGCSRSRDDVQARQFATRVRTELLHAWNNYERYAWGHDALRPLSKTPHDWYGQSLLMTPVDALDTLILMNLDAEAAKAQALIVNDLSFDRDIYVKNFEITIRLLGGLLSGYQLTNDKRLLGLAEDLGNRLLPTFNSPTGLPYVYVNLRTGQVRDPVSNPAETGTLLLEFGTLSKLTGKGVFYEKAKRALVETYKRRSPVGLVGASINVETGTWTDTDSHISGGIDSYYEYLWKCWLLFGDKDCLEMWNASIPAVHKFLADDTGGELWYGHADMQPVSAPRRPLARLTPSFQPSSRSQETWRGHVACKPHRSRCGICTVSNLKSSTTRRCASAPAPITCAPKSLNPLTSSIITRATRSIGGWARRFLTTSLNTVARRPAMPRSATWSLSNSATKWRASLWRRLSNISTCSSPRPGLWLSTKLS
jgi:hypothetical protein